MGLVVDFDFLCFKNCMAYHLEETILAFEL